MRGDGDYRQFSGMAAGDSSSTATRGRNLLHVHVESADGEAKYWLTPVALIGSSRLKPRELRDLEWFDRLNRKFLLEAWNDFFGR